MDGSRAESSRERVSPGAGGREALERVVLKLREIERRSGIERTLAVGELILGQFFGGDASLWRDRRRNKSNSIRRLADRQGCPFSKSALNEVLVFLPSPSHRRVMTRVAIGGSIGASIGRGEHAKVSGSDLRSEYGRVGFSLVVLGR